MGTHGGKGVDVKCGSSKRGCHACIHGIPIALSKMLPLDRESNDNYAQRLGDSALLYQCKAQRDDVNLGVQETELHPD